MLPAATIPCGTQRPSGIDTAAVNISFSLEAAPRDRAGVPVPLLMPVLSEAQVERIASSLRGFGKETANFLMAHTQALSPCVFVHLLGTWMSESLCHPFFHQNPGQSPLSEVSQCKFQCSPQIGCFLLQSHVVWDSQKSFNRQKELVLVIASHQA